jgi:dTMP kinase
MNGIRNMMSGLFITFEGPEGSGKSTHIRRLQQWLEKQGHKCLITREPGGTGIAETLREIVKYHNKDEQIYDETELLLFEASRAQHVRHLIKPALERGEIVLCDRFADSSTAYQGYARGLGPDTVRSLNAYAIGDCVPDLTLILDVPPEIGLARTIERSEARRDEDRMEAEALEFHRKVREGFLEIARLEPERVKVVSSLDDSDVVHEKIIGHTTDALAKI